MARTYKQGCIMAHTLDVLGERWTLLIVRQLLLGPQRFAELQGNLSGMGPNLLSKRLKDLEEAGIIESVTNGYRLTDEGEGLRSIALSIVRWGIRYFISPKRKDKTGKEVLLRDIYQPDSIALALEIMCSRRKLGEGDFVCGYKITDMPYTLFFSDSQVIMRRGDVGPTPAHIAADGDVYMQILRDQLSLEDALADGRMVQTGSEDVLMRINAAMFKRNASQRVRREKQSH
ncbi:MAG: helix-turn-helix domain-containing protein [Pseudomonadota bacterium]